MVPILVRARIRLAQRLDGLLCGVSGGVEAASSSLVPLNCARASGDLEYLQSVHESTS